MVSSLFYLFLLLSIQDIPSLGAVVMFLFCMVIMDPRCGNSLSSNGAENLYLWTC